MTLRAFVTRCFTQVLECLNPQGLVPPGEAVLVKFRFHPIEAKQYTVDLPITIARGYTTVVRFCATGYHPLVDNAALLGAPSPSDYSSWPGFTLATAEGLESAVVRVPPPESYPLCATRIPTVNGMITRFVASTTHGQLSAAHGSSTTVSRSDNIQFT